MIKKIKPFVTEPKRANPCPPMSVSLIKPRKGTPRDPATERLYEFFRIVFDLDEKGIWKPER